ncbi:MAG: superoxide dismutase family protein [Aequorivita sp.]
MKKLALSITVLALFAFTGCKNEKKDLDSVEGVNDSIQVDTNSNADIRNEPTKVVSVAMLSKSGSKAQGEVYFSEYNGVVRMEGKFKGLTPGTHAIHLHEKADCSADDAMSSGGHWNPTHQKHGKWGDSDGYHKGDIGNIEADENGNASIIMETDEWCIGCGDENKDILGKAVIVHERKDDFVSQPTGDAGGRVACGGVIE